MGSTFCMTTNIFGGFNLLGQGHHVYKTFSNIPPHYELNIRF